MQTAHGDHLFTHSPELAAEMYAKTNLSFEEVALKFINAGEVQGLKVFLLSKLHTLPNEVRAPQAVAESCEPPLTPAPPTQAKTQRSILCTWLLELYLNQVNQLLSEEDNPESRAEGHAIIQSEFEHFVTAYKAHFDPPTAFHLLASHGRVDMLLFYAGQIGDHERLLAHFLQREDWDACLHTLRTVLQHPAPAEPCQ